LTASAPEADRTRLHTTNKAIVDWAVQEIIGLALVGLLAAAVYRLNAQIVLLHEIKEEMRKTRMGEKD
jgi:hypothetical protein